MEGYQQALLSTGQDHIASEEVDKITVVCGCILVLNVVHLGCFFRGSARSSEAQCTQSFLLGSNE